MALPSSGTISMSQINVELGNSSTATLGLGSSSARGLAGVASGTIKMSDFHGKSSVPSEPPTTYCTGPSQTSTSFWADGGGDPLTWDGSKWTKDGAQGPVGYLNAVGTWKDGFRPSSVDITFYKPFSGNGSNGDFILYDTNNGTLGTYDFTSDSFDTQHTRNMSLTFTSYDIYRLRLGEFLYSGVQIRCIKFNA